MSRKIHLVGAWPGWSGAQAMETALERLGPHLLRITDGETGERSQWVMPTLEWLRANPDVEIVRRGDHSDYDHGNRFAVRDGHVFDPANIDLSYCRFFQRSYPAFRELRARHGLPDVSFQVGCPAPIDLAVDSFGYEVGLGDPQIAEGYAAATLREIEAIHAEAGDDEEPGWSRQLGGIGDCIGVVLLDGRQVFRRCGPVGDQSVALRLCLRGDPRNKAFLYRVRCGDHFSRAHCCGATSPAFSADLHLPALCGYYTHSMGLLRIHHERLPILSIGVWSLATRLGCPACFSGCREECGFRLGSDCVGCY